MPGRTFLSSSRRLRSPRPTATACSLYRDVLDLKKPATVPIAPWIGLLPFRFYGHTGTQAYYDYEIFKEDWFRFHEETMPDGLGLTLGIVPGKLFDVLDYHLYDWPGHGTPEDASYQYKEQEWMKGDEYAALIQDPGSYWQRTYLPRVFGALEPFSALAPWTDLVEIPFTAPFFAGFSAPPVKEMLKKLAEAGDAAMEWLEAAMAADGRCMADPRHPADRGRRHQGSLRHPRRHDARHARPHAGQVPPAGERQGRHGAAGVRRRSTGRSARTT